MSEQERKNLIEKVKTAVVKIGSSVLTHDDGSLDESVFKEIAKQVFNLKQRGVRTIIVSSGAIASGMKKLGSFEQTRRDRRKTGDFRLRSDRAYQEL